jgi:rfaE bifunctional protein nucleotidyltransferase chain/domain
MSDMSHRKGKIVFANGVFDLLHEGHHALLKFAKSQGDWLVVGLNSDESVKMLNKGPERPIHSEQHRKANLEKLEYVDEVVIFDDLRTTAIVREVYPHVVVKGSEYSADLVRSTDKIPDDIEIIMAPILHDENGEKISTTAIIKKMRKGAK